MNARIKSLIDQATVWQGMENGYIFDKEKFAELIVRDCAGVNYKSPFRDGEFHAREVFEYFGVEE